MSSFNIQEYPIVLEKPEKIVFPYNWIEHIPFAFFLIDILKPKILVELGVHTGNSFNAFCQAVKTLNIHTKCYGVDVWTGDEHAGFYEEEILYFLSKYQQENYNEFAHLMKMYFDEAVNKFEHGSIDLLHIDGLHTYEAVKHDFETWLPKMSDQGVVIFHDTQVHGRDFGVHQFWKEISKEYPHFEFKNCNGLGVLAIGTKVNEIFLNFLKTANENDSTSKLFESLGGVISFKENLINNSKELSSIKATQSEVQLLKNKVINLEEIIFWKDTHIRNLESMLKFKKYRSKIFKYASKKIAKILLIESVNKKIKKWKEKHKKYSYKLDVNINKIELEIENFPYKPLISIIMPVYNIDPKWLDLAINSVKKQLYQNWELCIVDDCSTNSATIKYIKYIKDDKIKIKCLNQNKNISYASNEALKLASGEYIALLDHDDELTIDALYEVVKAINKTGADLIYSDEDKISSSGKSIDPHFKPDYSPDQLLSQNYICHLGVYKKSIIDLIGGFSEGMEGSQDYDLVLKFVEKTNKIYHIPKVLYHWRMMQNSTAEKFSAKAYADDNALKAVENTLLRRRMKGKVMPGIAPGTYYAQREISDNPLISIIIPFKDKPELLKGCLDSILTKSTYNNFEIIAISNNSVESSTYKMMEEYKKEYTQIKFLEYNIPFNYSELNNYGVSLSGGSHIILLNNDIEIINSDWIERLLEHSQREEVGAVGAKLYYPNNTLQHGGVIIGLGGVAGHSHKYSKKYEYGYFSRLSIVHNLSAVTGACLMVKKSIYEEVNGLNIQDLKIAFNDVDFCLRIREKGYLNIFTPYCEAYHHESISRGYEDTPEKQKRFEGEVNYIKARHKDILEKGDPYYNPNLTLSKEDFSLAYSNL